ncbi:MAG: DivIVA domain-containing protein [Clostridia bacterium]|nr:DivIVA domain-containing protein [Clostridia bacterium]
MLKTEQILNVKFTPVSKGTYNAEEVDAFLKVVAQSYESLTVEKNELIKKMSILADKIESYRSDEEAIKLSLLDAHRMAETIGKNATIKSETLIGDAETRAQLIVDGANRQSAKSIEEAKEQAKEIVENAKTAVASLTERAQSESDAAIASAKAKAASIVSDAENEAKRIVGSSKEAYDFYTAELARIQAASIEFKAAMTAVCNEQLALIESVPETIVAPLAYESSVADEVEVTADLDEAEEISVESEEIIAELDEEIAAIENAAEEADADYSDIPEADNEPAEEAEELDGEIREIEPEADEDIEDIFSLIDDIDLEIDTDSIPESLDELVASPEAEETVEVENEVQADEAEDDVFDGFKIDLDSLGLDDGGDDDDEDDITSLFDSMFDE